MTAIRVFILLVALFSGCMCMQRAPMVFPKMESDADAIDFLKGFIEGLGINEDIEKIKNCAQGVEDLVEKIKEALPYLRNMNPADLKQGLAILFEGLKLFLYKLKACVDSGSTLWKLRNLISSANLPKIVFQIMSHPVQFLSDVKNGVECFASGDWYCGGKAIGDILKIIFL